MVIRAWAESIAKDFQVFGKCCGNECAVLKIDLGELKTVIGRRFQNINSADNVRVGVSLQPRLISVDERFGRFWKAVPNLKGVAQSRQLSVEIRSKPVGSNGEAVG